MLPSGASCASSFIVCETRPRSRKAILRARAHRAFERVVWHERINKRAIERFRSTAQGFELDRPAFFRSFERRDARRLHSETAGELDPAHAKCIADGAHPPFGRRSEALGRLQGNEAFIQALPGTFASFCFHSAA